MASGDEIQQIRAAQRQAGDRGETLSYRDAQRMLSNPPPQAKSEVDIAWLNLALSQTQAKLDAAVNELTVLKGDVAGFRIMGPGFTGVGPRGIGFEPEAAGVGNGGSGGTPVGGTVIVRWCVGGTAVDYYISAEAV